jgi:hypothetical protein
VGNGIFCCNRLNGPAPLSLPPDTAHKVSVCQSVGAIHQSNNRSSRNPITDQLSYVIIILIRVFCPSLSTHDSRKKKEVPGQELLISFIHTYIHTYTTCHTSAVVLAPSVSVLVHTTQNETQSFPLCTSTDRHNPQRTKKNTPKHTKSIRPRR